MSIFEFSNYRAYLRNRQKSMPGKGRGELTRMAQALGVHTTMISHIMKGSADFSIEQSLKLADYLGLSELETDYLLAMVQLERAGDKRTKDYISNKLKQLKTQALDLKTRLAVKNELSEEDRALFYSSPTYAYVRLLCAIERFQTFESLLEESQLLPKRLRSILEFLVSRGLCREEGHRYIYADRPTYIEASSPLVARHHINWRMKAQERIENLRQEDLSFTYPTAMSEADFQIFREKLVQLIEEFKAFSAPSPSENIYCFNLDWLKISRR